MKILIDADACPVIDITIRIANQKNIQVLLVCDTAHIAKNQKAETIIVSKGGDSADFALVNMVNDHDIVITQDYGLAAMALAKKAKVINQNGLIYTEQNIDGLLLSRHISKKIRNSGGRVKGPAKRSKENDVAFENALLSLLE